MSRIELVPTVILPGVWRNLQPEGYNETRSGNQPPRREITVHHLLRNATAPLIVNPTRIAAAILAESALSFLELVGPPRQTSWGNMLNYAEEYRRTNPMLTVHPVSCVFLS